MPNPIDRRIAAFLRKHHVLCLASAGSDAEPWCCHLFYALLDERTLVFTSSAQTRHIGDIAHNAVVAGGIVLESRVVGRLQGLQLQGIVSQPDPETEAAARAAYLKRFPYARLLPAERLWLLDLTLLKYTDNTLGFGTKLHWKAETFESFDTFVGALKTNHE